MIERTYSVRFLASSLFANTSTDPSWPILISPSDAPWLPPSRLSRKLTLRGVLAWPAKQLVRICARVPDLHLADGHAGGLEPQGDSLGAEAFSKCGCAVVTAVASGGEDGECDDGGGEPGGHGDKKAHGRTPSQACERPPTGARIPFVTLTPERHGPGGPTGLQNRCGVAAPRSVGSTPAPLR